jgi:hypothetical protein
VHYDARTGKGNLDVMRWGLIPFWPKDIKIGFSTFNARSEDVDTKPAFREAFPQRRCPVPLDKTAAGKQPYAVALADRPRWHGGVFGDLALAGGRPDAQLHHHHHGAEITVRRASWPDAGCPQTPSGRPRARPLTDATSCRRDSLLFLTYQVGSKK